jgi:hypothetical protein
MKRLFLSVVLVLCAIVGALVWSFSHSGSNHKIVAAFVGFTNGVPNWTVDSWFIKASPDRAELMLDWFKAGTNAARFSVTNASQSAIRVSPIARFEAQDWIRDTPVLTTRNFRGLYIGPGEARVVQVAKLAHPGQWRIRFCYVRDDETDNPFIDAAREIGIALSGSRSGNADPFPVAFSSGWVKQ